MIGTWKLAIKHPIYKVAQVTGLALFTYAAKQFVKKSCRDLKILPQKIRKKNF